MKTKETEKYCLSCGASGHTYLECTMKPFLPTVAGMLGVPDLLGPPMTPEQETPTPRTDEQIKNLGRKHGDLRMDWGEYCDDLTDFARQLERENRELREAIEAAPHENLCKFLQRTCDNERGAVQVWTRGECNCWKRRALEGK
jgi:hypothetical protein